MIKELSDLGKILRKQNEEGKIIHDALKDEPISIDLIIKKDGSFYKFETIEKIWRPAEAITAKKGKARLLLDKAEEVLGYGEDGKKHELFIRKLTDYSYLDILKPVFDFIIPIRKAVLKKPCQSLKAKLTRRNEMETSLFELRMTTAACMKRRKYTRQ